MYYDIVIDLGRSKDTSWYWPWNTPSYILWLARWRTRGKQPRGGGRCL